MKNIQLFHSYNFVYGNFIKKNKDVYDKNGKLLFSLLNIPDESKLYKIKIQRILNKKCFSKKVNKSCFYTKHNLKIFLVINYSELISYLDKNIPVPDIDIVCNLINSSINIYKEQLLNEFICINKSFNKKIICKNNITFKNNYLLSGVYLDLINKQIVKKPSSYKFTLNGSIIFYDMLTKFVIDLQSIFSNNTLFICDDNKVYDIISNVKNIVALNINTIDSKIVNNKWKNIIYLKNSLYTYNHYNLKKFGYKNLFVCFKNDGNNIKIKNIIDTLKYYYNLEFTNNLINTKFVNNLMKLCVFRSYYNKSIQKNFINHSLSYRNSSETCVICYNNCVNVETSCKHRFCMDCINRISNSNKFNCPMCRKENFKNKIKIIGDSKIDYNFKKNSAIISNNINKIKFYKSNNIDVLDISKVKTIDKDNIYFLESFSEYNINNFVDILSSQKSKLNFFF